MRKGRVSHGKDGTAMTNGVTIHMKGGQLHFDHSKIRTCIGNPHAEPLREPAIANHCLCDAAGHILRAVRHPALHFLAAFQRRVRLSMTGGCLDHICKSSKDQTVKIDRPVSQVW